MPPGEKRTHQLLHATEDALELYSLNLLHGSELAALEEHLLLCANCRQDLDQVDHAVSLMRIGLKALELQERAAVLIEKKDGGKIIMFRPTN